MTSDYAALPDPEAAALISAEVADWDRQEPLRHATLGLMCLTCERRELWQLVTDPTTGQPCHSHGRWLRVCAPRGYSACYQAMRDVEAIRGRGKEPEIPEVDIAQIPHESFPAMKHLSTGVRRRPEVLRAAKAGRDALVQHIQKHHSDQHIEATEDLRLHPTSTQKAIILQAIEAAIQRGDGATKEEVIEGWAVESLQGQGEAPAARKEAIQ